MQNTQVSTFYILDLDRTLFDTAASVEVMRGVVAMHDADLAAALEQRFEEYTQLGESFSMRDFILEQVGEDEMRQIEEKYHQFGTQRDLLNPGARELIAYIRSKADTAFGILTYGAPLGQAMKIKAAVGLENIPFMVTSETFKGALIASWRQDDDLYHIPEELGGYVTKNIVFVDDKPFSFKGLPIDCRGYIVKTMYDAGIEKLPAQVVIVNDLNEVITAEKAR